jgi:DNA-binding transcriptional regulator YiaG
MAAEVSKVIATALPAELLRELDDLADTLRGTRWDAAAGGLAQNALLRLAADTGRRALQAGLEAPPEGWPEAGGEAVRVRLRVDLLAEMDGWAKADGLSRYAALRTAIAAGVRVLRAEAEACDVATEGRGIVARLNLADETWRAGAGPELVRAELRLVLAALGIPAALLDAGPTPTPAEALATMARLTEGTPAAELPEVERRAELADLPQGQVERRDGERFRVWREGLGWSQRELASRIDVGQATVSRWERTADAEGNPCVWSPALRARLEAMMLNPPVELLES